MDDGIVVDKGGKRQLPQWMFAEKVKTNRVDNNNTEKEIVTQRLKNRKIKDKNTEECQTAKRSRRKLNDEASSMGTKCEKNSKIEGGAEIEESTKASRLRKSKCGNSNEAGPSSRRHKQKAVSFRIEHSSNVEESAPKTDDDDFTVKDLMSIAQEYAGDADEDLTVEDLMCIAKEYVNVDEEAASVEDKGGPTEDAISMSTGSLSCIGVDNQLLTREEANTDCIEDASPPPKLSMSENPTQDMLDVFLGPLLKKTRDEKSIKLVREDMSFAHDVNKKNQSEASGVQPLLVKKKSSLKDRIALFLD